MSNLKFIKSGVSVEHNFSWVLAALREHDKDGWLIEDQLVIAQRQGLEPLTADDVDKIPPAAWREFRKKDEE